LRQGLTGGEFGDEHGISPKMTADFGAHVAAGGNQESYLNQFGTSGRRRRKNIMVNQPSISTYFAPSAAKVTDEDDAEADDDDAGAGALTISL
jgi:hypothetical protein